MIFRLSPYGIAVFEAANPSGQCREGLLLFPLLQHLPHHAAAVGPDSAVMLWRWSIYMARSNRSRTVRGMAGLREVTVIHHDGVEPIAWGRSRPRPPK